MPGVFQELPAGGVEHDALGDPVEQPDAELGLQRADLLAQRRLLDVEPPRGAGHRAFLGDRYEITQMPEFHDLSPRSRSYLKNINSVSKIYFTYLPRLVDAGNQ